MPMILGGSGTINTSSSLAVAVAGVEDVRIDASGRVGIGTTTPGHLLHINNPSASGYSVTRFQSDSRTYDFGVGGSSTGSLSNALYAFDVTAGAVRMQIDSSGRVTTPFQPAWVAYGSVEAWYNSVGVVPFNNASYTRNCSYDTTNSRFTAPISGLYNISWSFLAGTNGNAGHISLRKNASYIIEVMHGQSSAAEYDYTGGSMPVYLASGDYVDMYMSATFSSGIYMGSNAGRYAVFAGFLIG